MAEECGCEPRIVKAHRTRNPIHQQIIRFISAFTKASVPILGLVISRTKIGSLTLHPVVTWSVLFAISALSSPAQQAARAISVLPVAPAITLDEAIRRAKANEPSFAAAVAANGVSKLDRSIARSALLPTVTYLNQFLYTQGTGALVRDNPAGTLPTPRFIANNAVHEYTSQGVVNETIGLQQFAAASRASAAAAVAAANLEIARRGLVSTVVGLFYASLISDNKVAVAILALALVFGVLLAEFRNFSAPIAILTSSVLSITGVVVALLITGTNFNVASFMGLIMVIGIVAKNGILLLDADEKSRATGVNARDAMLHAAQRRLRPIMMTAIAAICGMLPLAFALGSGSQMLQPLAIAVIGGLLLSILLSLIVTPVVYYYLTSHRKLEVEEYAL
ncbi:MAG TPA: efflux RND transporter permease subunit [Acidobacteriaceae bacterium]